MAEQYSTVYRYVCIYIYISMSVSISHFFIHSSVDGQLGCFRVFATVNGDTVNMGVQISLRESDFVFFRYIPRSRIAGSYGSSTFHFL